MQDIEIYIARGRQERAKAFSAGGRAIVRTLNRALAQIHLPKLPGVQQLRPNH